MTRYLHLSDALVIAGHLPTAPATASPYLTADEAAVYCKVAKQTIYNHRRHIERQPGIGKLLFTRDNLDKWLATRKRRRYSGG